MLNESLSANLSPKSLDIIWTFICFLILILIYNLFLKPYLFIKYYKLQSAVGNYTPGIGFFIARLNDVQINGDFMHFFKKEIDSKKAVPMIATNLGSRVILYLVDHDLIKAFSSSPTNLYIKHDLFSDLPNHLRKYFSFSEGNPCKVQKQLVSQVFHNECLKEVIPLMFATTEHFLNNLLLTKLDDINITKINQRIVGEVFGKFFFGNRFSSYTFEGKPLSIAFSELFSFSRPSNYSAWEFFIRPCLIGNRYTRKTQILTKKINGLSKICEKIIADKRKFTEEEEKERTLLQLFIDNQRDSPENCVTDEEIINTFFCLYAEGVESLSLLVTMSLYYLSQNTYRQEKIMDEVNKTLVEEPEIGYKTLKRMSYTNAVLKETLRKTNPVAFSTLRKARKTHLIEDVKIRKGTYVTCSSLFNGCNGKYFPLANEFLPERWLLPENNLWREQISMCTPFSYGPKNCIGKNWSMLQGKVILISFLKKFKMEAVNNLSLKFTYTTCYKPCDDIRMKLSTL